MIRRHRRFLLALAAGALLLGAPIQHGYDARHHAHATVTDFNDGFADSKRDDCEHGFAAACQWLEAR
ncbi:hypothetical protein [Streptomyces cinnamoneus]|uniref:hypothetical protein n=1 Tax=Streptomyces cinnamoneus TaxID=53446 RepID=UPI000CEED98C|nr:hypothetical protein [Streptomyces cinnamoneus]PPT14825.1 hypothetical protein CYQ11_19875 [Streptomyces cinnamoneus]